RADVLHLLLQRRLQGVRRRVVGGEKPLLRPARLYPDALLLPPAHRALPADAGAHLPGTVLGIILSAAGGPALDADDCPLLWRRLPPGHLRPARAGRVRAVHAGLVPAPAALGALAGP